MPRPKASVRKRKSSAQSAKAEEPSPAPAAAAPAPAADNNGAGSEEPAAKKAKTTPAVSARVTEHGHLYFFYRPKVDTETVQSFDDVQRLYLVMAVQKTIGGDTHLPAAAAGGAAPAAPGDSIAGDALKPAHFYRIILVPKKKLPTPLGGGNRFRPEMAFVDLVTRNVDDIHRLFGTAHHRTKTRGERTDEPCRLVGEAEYELIASQSRKQPVAHLAYVLECPTEPSAVQQLFGIAKEERFVLQVKNPLRENTNATGVRVGLDESQKAQFPADLQKLFAGARTQQRKFIAADPPALLNFHHTELLIAGPKTDLAKFGAIGRELEKAGAAHAHPEAQIYRDLHLPAQEHPSALKQLK